jgi:Tol biopolymer transport system component
MCLLLLALAPGAGLAQESDDEDCMQLVDQVLAELGTTCAQLGHNYACYGFDQVRATFFEEVPADFFTLPGDETELTTLQTISTAAMDLTQSRWGIATMNVLANLPDTLPGQGVVFLLLGDVSVENAVLPDEALLPAEPVSAEVVADAPVRSAPGLNANVIGSATVGDLFQADGVGPEGEWVRVLYGGGPAWIDRASMSPAADFSSLPTITSETRTPMQAFYFSTGFGTPTCGAAPPSVLVVQGPEGLTVDITANGADIRVESTVFLRTLPGPKMELITGYGAAILYPDSTRHVVVPAGASVTAPLDEYGNIDGSWSDWRMLSQMEMNVFSSLERVSENVLNYTYVTPQIVQPSGAGEPPYMVQTAEGVFVPVEPLLFAFPTLSMAGQEPGTALTRPDWESIAVGGAVCPPWMLYHSDQDDDWDIYRLGDVSLGDGLNDNVSLGEGSADIHPSISSDGEWFAFTSDRDEDGDWEIWVGRTDGSVQRRLTYNTGADINPVWGPGNRIVFESDRDANWELYLVNVADGVPVRLTDDPANDINPAWLPGGESIVFQSDRDGDWEIYLLNLESGELIQLTDNDTEDKVPAVSHDGTMLAWLQRNAFGADDLWLMDLETGEIEQLTDMGTHVGGHVFAPDDTFVAFHSNVDGDFDVFVVDLTFGIIKDITDNDYDDRAPAFWCGMPLVIYHSDAPATGGFVENRGLFEVNPLPIEGLPNAPFRLTDDSTYENVYPMGDARDEVNSREGHVPPHPGE